MYETNAKAAAMMVGRGAPPDCVAARESRIGSALEQQEKMLAMLTERIAELTARLQPVLAPQPEKDGMGMAGNQIAGNNIGSRIDVNTGRVSYATSRINALLEALEL